MTQENKELLLKDLCAKLQYNVIVDYGYNAFDVRKGNYIKHGSKRILDCDLLDVFISPRQNEKGEYIKPYLRPMSSMTEEEKLMYEGLMIGIDNISYMLDVIDWLNSHHFDYRGLIEKGLAIDATKLNIYWIMALNNIEKSRDTPLL